ncbi:hypothetical protein D9611_010406 [Ephemerocybe angulata]|uniref:Uncharacterized protein n=1 Tax=Ephemerocybe angulata TaxID=980116 RepID=A0A8H5BX40_9AGAR|nr:hypothetical protein D9611_010406 [Tulosesus angulatus]
MAPPSTSLVRPSLALPLALTVLLNAASTSAYSWAFDEPPIQCGDLKVTISGDDGKPPYRILIIPSGPTTLPNNIEARTILDVPFDAGAKTLSFKLKYPENTKFVAVGNGSTANVITPVSSLPNPVQPRDPGWQAFSPATHTRGNIAFSSATHTRGSTTFSVFTGDHWRVPRGHSFVPRKDNRHNCKGFCKGIPRCRTWSVRSVHSPSPLPHPTVSDASGFGSGGTSVAANVAPSDDATCFDSSKSVQPQWYFSILPANQIVQCFTTRIFWTPSDVQGTPHFVGVIPGGQSFSIPQGTLSTQTGQGTGFDWKANLRTGTELLLIGGDDRGAGSGGSVPNVVSAGINPDSSCINATSPSATPGSPAGGSYPTSSQSTGDAGNTKGKNNTGAIAGGVVGGVVALLAALLFFILYRKRQRERARVREKPLDLLNEEEDGDEDGRGDRRSRNDLPEYYQPQPFTVPDSTVAGSVVDGDTDSIGGRRPLSGGTTATSMYTSGQRPGTPDGSAVLSGTGASRKGAPQRVMRPVNIIQHDDAGPSYSVPNKGEEGEAETIELPPAYTALKGGDTEQREGE